MIKKLTIKEADRGFEIITACRKYMHSIGIPQWTEHYPTTDTINNDIEKEEAFGYFQDEILAGIVILNEHQDVQYLEIDWHFKVGKIGIVHRLAVHPEFHKHGIAGKLMRFAENYFTQREFSSIRLDAFSMNEVALKFYDNLYYERRGEVFFPFRERSFWCFEKQLNR